MSDKVKLTKEQAEAIKIILNNPQWRKEQIIEHHTNDHYAWVNEYSDFNGMPLDTLVRAIYIGYEVEETREEKVQRQFLNPIGFYDKENDNPQTIYRKGMQFVLEAFEIKIPGVNE